VEGHTGQPANQNVGNGENGAEPENPLTGAGAAGVPAKVFALTVLFGGLAYCVLIAGLAEFSHNVPFETEANFALFAAFIVVAGAIERFIQPLTAILPPFKKEGKKKGDKDEEKREEEELKADRTLIAYGIALVVGIAISSCFGLYFLETMGVEIGTTVTSGDATHVLFHGNGEKMLRGLDILITALIITGGTKPLHDMITSIEKKKDAIGNN
jgi:hypothetical protein